MAKRQKVNFEFQNQVSPRYLESLFLPMERETWYESTELRQFLRDGGLDVQGKNIIQANTVMWARVGLGEIERGGRGQPNLFRLSPLGSWVQELYSTNQELFFDLIHYLYYSSWRRSGHLNQAPTWLYAAVCDVLWEAAPGKMDSFALTRRLQSESRMAFPEYEPNFSERSVRGPFTWLGVLTPPFLSKCGNKSELCSQRRSYCTPQLFHLAVELAYATEGLQYGTSLAVDEAQIATICRTCLLDVDHFWDMASLADMAMRELEVRKGQWGTSLALLGPPQWITLPDFADQDEE